MSKISWKDDYYRSNDDEKFVLLHFLRDYVFHHRLRYIIYFRKAQNAKFKLSKLYFAYKLHIYQKKYGIEIKPSTKIGKGFMMTHAYNITVSPFATIGENVTMMKGSTIGLSGGKRRGAPTIGNCVYIGINSTIVGNVTIGNDVLIAPNTFVNQDIPDHSIVIGNPCVIIPKENATAEYIWKKV